MINIPNAIMRDIASYVVIVHYHITNKLLSIVYKLALASNIKITCINKDWRGKEYQSDLVTIDEANHIGFEVLENEIIFFLLFLYTRIKRKIVQREYGYTGSLFV
jgi:hypothetical protein